MRITFLVPSLAGGGAEFVARTWAQMLGSFGHDVNILLTHAKREDVAELGELAQQLGVGIERLDGAGFIGHAMNLRSRLRDTQPDVAIALMPYWNLLLVVTALSIKRGRPRTVISGRNMVVPLLSVHGKRLWVKHMFSKVFYRRADIFLAISHPVAAETMALYGVRQDRITVVPNPALAKLTSGRAVVSQVQREMDRINIVVPARLVHQKRPHLAVEVAERVHLRTGIPVSLTFFGRGPLKTEIADFAEQRGVTVAFAWAEKWFEKCPRGVVLLPSVSEGFGNVLVEAAASGMWSVVSSRCLGSADAVVPNMTGILAGGDSVEDFTRAVIDAASRDEVSMVDAWLQRFQPDESARQLEDLLFELINQPRDDAWSTEASK